MSRLRIISVWVVAVSSILIVYRIYNRISDTPVIEPPGAPSAYDLSAPIFDETSPAIGPARVGEAENARYTFVDEQTKKVTRVFGFQKLLNPEAGTRKWNLQKPYMHMYEKGFDCEITADRGTLTVETLKGNPSPTEGQLYENVVIRIRAKDTDRPIDSMIYLDHLNYNSERSEFSTDGPLRVVSPRADMVGRGMLLIYNPALNRIEFLKVVDLDYLHLKDVENLSSGNDGSRVAAGSATASKGTLSGPRSVGAAPVQASATAKPTKNQEVAKQAQVAAKPVVLSRSEELYMCTFSRDVVIEYGGEITVEGAQEVFIDNILWARTPSKSATSSPDAAAGPEQAQEGGQAASAVPLGESSAETVRRQEGGGVERAEPAAGDASGTSVDDSEAVQEGKAPIDVRVTCRGGFVAKPLTSVFEIIEPTLPRQSAGEVLGGTRSQQAVQPISAAKDNDADSTGGGAARGMVAAAGGEGELPTPAYFKARRITYDMNTGFGLAEGPVALAFQPADEKIEANTTVFPMVVTAEKNAQFFAGEDRMVERIVFNENVVGTRKVQTTEYLETSRFYGRTLTTNLETDKESDRNGEINHISVTEGNVKLESIRTGDNGDIVSNVRLVCLRIDYDAVKSIVHASGPGFIELNNQNVPARTADEGGGKLSLSGPCFARVRGFDRLTWFTEAMQINADGKDESLDFSYIAVENGKLGQRIDGATTHLQANFWPLPDGGSELATVITAGGIYYEEVGSNVFMGEDLLYDAEKGLLVITSSEENACLLNGALVDRIEYEVNTGKVVSTLASSPGAITVPVKP